MEFIYKEKYADNPTIEITEDGKVIFSHPFHPDDLPVPQHFILAWAIAIIVSEAPKQLVSMVEKKANVLERYGYNFDLSKH